MLHLFTGLASVVMLAPSQADAGPFVICSKTHQILGLIDAGGVTHTVSPSTGSFTPAFSPPIEQGALVEILLDKEAPPRSSMLFSTMNGGTAFHESAGSPIFPLGTSGGLFSYLTVIPYWATLLPGGNFEVALQQMGCASTSDRRLQLPISWPVKFTYGMQGPLAISAPWGITAVATGPTTIFVTWEQASAPGGFNEFGFEVEAKPDDSTYPTIVKQEGIDASSMSISGLVPGRRYQIAVYSIDGQLNRVTSQLVEFPFVTLQVFGGPGTITSLDAPAGASQNPICAANSLPAYIDGVYDTGNAGEVDGANADPLAEATFPFGYIENPSLPRGYEVISGKKYAFFPNSNTQTNVILFVPAVFTCGSLSGPRFVAVHATQIGGLIIPHKIIAGTAFSAFGEMVGVVAESEDIYVNTLTIDGLKVGGKVGAWVGFTEPGGTQIQYEAYVELDLTGTILRPDTAY